MKIKNLLLKSIQKVDSKQQIRDTAFDWFLINLMDCVTFYCGELLKRDAPDLRIDGKKISEEKGVSEISSLIHVLNGVDLFRHFQLFQFLGGFIPYFLEQEEPQNENIEWFEIEFIAKKWNEYCQKQKLEEEA